MKLEELEITNFGQHKHLKITFDGAAIVGIMGISGRGKTTVLKAIEYAFTGQLPGKQNEWITYGEKSSTVGLKFSTGGKPCRITRKITPTTSSRSVLWGEKEYKTAKETDEVLAQIFGADKEAISNAVFINQGELYKILDGTDTERCTLFIKLINLFFCERHVFTLEHEIKYQRSLVEDLTPQIDITKNDIELLKQDIEKAEFAKGALDVTAVDLLQQYSRYKIDLIEQRTTEEKYSMNLGEINSTLMRIQQVKATTKGDIQENLDSASKAVSECSNKTNILTMKAASYQNVVTFMSQKNEYSSKVLDIEKELVDYPAGDDLYISEINEEIKTRALLNATATKVNKLTEEYNIAQKQKTAHEELTPVGQQEIDALAQQGAVLSDNIAKATQRFTAQQGLFKKGCKDKENRCADCGLKLADEVTITKESLEVFSNSIQESNSLLVQLRASWKEKNTERTNFLKEQTKLDNSVQLLSQQLITEMTAKMTLESKLNVKFHNRETPALQESILVHNKNNTKRIELLNSMGIYQRQLVAVEAKLIGIDTEKDYTEEISNINKEIEELKVKLETNKVEVARLNCLNLDLARLKAKYTEQQHLNDLYTTHLKELRLRPVPTSVENLDLKIAQLELEVTKLNEITGEINSLNGQLNAKNVQLNVLNDKVSAFKETLVVIKSLEAVQNALRRDGIPMRCVNGYFNQLLNLTQRNLEMMNAEFVISVDAEKPVSFTFQKLTDPTMTLQKQHKLSGGEKVKLSVAFLLSVQQLLLPNFGFQVLDEPSLHLDQNSRDSLADLLIHMSGILHNANNQIVISDHSQELIRSFNKLIVL